MIKVKADVIHSDKDVQEHTNTVHCHRKGFNMGWWWYCSLFCHEKLKNVNASVKAHM